VSCEVYGEVGRVGEPQFQQQAVQPIQPMPQQMMQFPQPMMPMPQPIQPMPPMMQFPQMMMPQFQPLTEERVREIVFEMLVQLGLVKPAQKKFSVGKSSSDESRCEKSE